MTALGNAGRRDKAARTGGQAGRKQGGQKASCAARTARPGRTDGTSAAHTPSKVARSARSAGLAAALKLTNSARKVYLMVRDALDRAVPLQAALSEVLAGMALPPDVRRQATDLVYTAVRSEERCLFVLRTLYPKFGHFSKPVQRLLTAACAALLFQDKAPAYAIVSETVSDATRLGGKGTGAAVNWGLRSLLRLGTAPHEEAFYRQKQDKDDYAAFLRMVSVPEATGRLLAGDLGEEEARAVLAKSFARPLASLRLNALQPDCAGLYSELITQGWEPLPGRAGKHGLFAPASHGVREHQGASGAQTAQQTDVHALVRAGRASLQSAGSQLALAFPDFEADIPLWDMCAGFGGKTCALLEAGYEVSMASDTSFRRLHGLPGECTRLGLTAPLIVQADGTRPPLSAWQGDIVLDVPCTGLGVLARRPDIKLRPVDVAGHTQIQTQLLQQALALIPVGRKVIYMTCTVTRQENENLVRACAKGNGAELEGEWKPPLDSPWEGMYVAVLRKKA